MHETVFHFCDGYGATEQLLEDEPLTHDQLAERERVRSRDVVDAVLASQRLPGDPVNIARAPEQPSNGL